MTKMKGILFLVRNSRRWKIRRIYVRIWPTSLSWI